MEIEEVAAAIDIRTKKAKPTSKPVAPIPKTGKRCKNLAAYGCKTCRYHGARRNILKGNEHPNYKHGNRTKESMATYSNKVAELDHLEAIAHSVGIMEGPKRSGRKPKVKLKK